VASAEEVLGCLTPDCVEIKGTNERSLVGVGVPRTQFADSFKLLIRGITPLISRLQNHSNRDCIAEGVSGRVRP